MLKAFDATFDEGLTRPFERTTLNRWVDVLDLAADNLLICPSCKGSYYRNMSSCPWCDEKVPRFILGIVYHFDPLAYKKHIDQNDGLPPENIVSLVHIMKPIGSIVFQENTIRSIERRTAFLDSGLAATSDVVDVETKSGRLKIQPNKGETVWLSDDGFSKFHCFKRLKNSSFPAAIGQVLHFGDRSKPHCIVQFKKSPVKS
jgi:hypothetical protein